MIAANRFDTNASVVQLLIHAGAELTARNAHGQTPLMIAAKINSPQVVTALLVASSRFEAKLNTQGCQRFTPLMIVAKSMTYLYGEAASIAVTDAS